MNVYRHSHNKEVIWALSGACNRAATLFIGKGRGRQVIAVARTADVVIMMLDATKGDIQRLVSMDELD